MCAELNKAEQDRLLPVFLDAFNSHHAVAYELADLAQCPDTKPSEIRDASADFIFVNEDDGELKVQWTAADTPSEERIALVNEIRFVADLRERLDRAGAVDMAACITYKIMPHDATSRERLVEGISTLIETVGLLDLKEDEERRFSDRDLASVDLPEMHEIIVLGARTASVPFIVSSELAAAIQSSAERVRVALENKDGKLGASASDLVLVVHFDLDAYSEDEVEHMCSALGSQPTNFKEVWVLRDTSLSTRADIVREAV